LKKHNNSGKKSEPTSKPTKSRGAVQRDTKEVLAELVGKLKERLAPKKVAATNAGEKCQSGELRPNLDRLTVGVDLGDQWSHYCILGLEGGNAGGGTAAYDAAAHCRILSGIECSASGFRGGDTLCMGAGNHLQLRTRSAGGQPPLNGRIEASQAQE